LTIFAILSEFEMKDLTNGNVSKLLLQFVWPMLIGNVFQQMYNIVDSIIVGNYIGKEALAAVGASHPVIFGLVGLIIGITTGLSIVISQYYGAKDYEKVKLASDTTYIFITITALILTAVGIFFAEPVIGILKLPEEILADTIAYYKIYLTGLVFMFGLNSSHAILRGLGDSKTPLYFLLFSTVLNIGLDLLFVVGFGWGIESVAWATVLSQCIPFIAIALYVNAKHPLIRISFTGLTYSRKILAQSLRIGLPSGFQQTFVALGIMALVRIVSEFGTDAMAAYTIASRIDTFTVLPALNLAAALSMFVGQNIGANKIYRVYEGHRSAWKINAYISIIITASCLIFRKELIAVFNSDPEVIRIGSEYLLIVSGFYLIFGSMFLIQGVLRGAGDTIIPMFITLFALWGIRIPLSYYFSRFFDTNGIWWGIPMAWIIGYIFSFYFYKTGRWKTKGVVVHEPVVPDAIDTQPKL
jgi:putative MATE family efflux protein